jgi:hypothetical protein
MPVFGHDCKVFDIPQPHLHNQNASRCENSIIANILLRCQHVLEFFRMRRVDESAKVAVMTNLFPGSGALAGVLIGVALHGVTWSQPYPDRPVRLVVQGAASSAPDIIMRPIAQRFSQSVGQPVIVDNRPGAGGVVAAQIAVSARPDGYTILVAASGTISIVPFLMKKQPYDPLEDLAPVTLVAIAPLIVTAHPSFPVTSVKDLIALARLVILIRGH